MTKFRPNRLLAIVVVAVCAAGAVGWAVGANVRSPADAAAAHEAPPASLITVPVERRVLTATVVTRGTVQFGSPQPLALAGAVGDDTASNAPGSDAAGPASQRVTRPPVAGQTLSDGSVLMEINGRPVFVFAGPVPMFRTLGPGRTGDDVRQLQQALGRLGMSPGPANGAYTQQTAKAVQQWYRSKGYASQDPSFADLQQLHTLEQAVQQAVEGKLAAKAALDEAKAPATKPTDRQLAELRYQHAVEDLSAAQSDLDEYKKHLGTTVPAGEVVFLPSLPVRLTKVTVKTGQSVDGDVGTVTSATTVIQANVTHDDAALLHTGIAAGIETLDGGTVPGTVTALGDAARPDSGADAQQQPGDATPAPPDTGQSSDVVPLVIAPADQKPFSDQVDATVKVSIVVGSTKDAVLVVPVAAVTTGADGQARVGVQRPGGRTETVPVRVGLTALGYVQVSPSGSQLTEGDRVVVGTK